jgi:hypothetical protein
MNQESIFLSIYKSRIEKTNNISISIRTLFLLFAVAHKLPNPLESCMDIDF